MTPSGIEVIVIREHGLVLAGPANRLAATDAAGKHFYAMRLTWDDLEQINKMVRFIGGIE